MYKVGDRVKLTRADSVHHFTGPHMRDNPMPITGEIVEKDLDHLEGYHPRPYRIRFDDGRHGWYDSWEFKRIS